MKNHYLSKLQISLIFALLNISVFAQNIWTRKADFPATGRYVASAFSIGHYGYVGCGMTSSGEISDFYRWNQNTNSWNSIASYPGNGQYYCVSFSIGAKGFVGLGYGSGGPQQDLWSYDTTTNKWTQLATFPGTARYDASAFVIGTNAYIIGGETGGPPYLSEIWEYNSVTNTWKQKNNWPGSSRENVTAFAINNIGYAGCGNPDGAFIDNKKDFWKYDTASDSWTSVDTLPVTGTGVENAAPFVINGIAYAGSGWDQNGNTTRTFWAYDPSANIWASIASLTGPRRTAAASFSIGNKGYIVTGLDSAGNYLTDLWQYYPCSDTLLTSVNSITSQAESITIYPNPSKGIFNFNYNGLSSNKSELILIDITGRIVSTSTVSGKKGSLLLDESFLSEGMYFYSLVSEDKVIKTGKIIIAR